MGLLGRLIGKEDKSEVMRKICHGTQLFMEASSLLVTQQELEANSDKVLMYIIGAIDYAAQSNKFNQGETMATVMMYLTKYRAMEPLAAAELVERAGIMMREPEGLAMMMEGGNTLKAWLVDGNKNAPLRLFKLLHPRNEDNPMSPSEKSATTRASFSIGSYALRGRIESLPGLTELSSTEYAIMPRNFEGERIYKTPPVNLAGHTWNMMIGTVNSEIYKLAPYLEVNNEGDANIAARNALSYFTQELGEPSSQKTGLFVWDTTDGNVILQTAEVANGFAINIFATSASVRDYHRLS